MGTDWRSDLEVWLTALLSVLANYRSIASGLYLPISLSSVLTIARNSGSGSCWRQNSLKPEKNL